MTPSGRVIGEDGGIEPNGSFGINVQHDGAAVFNGVGRCPNRIPVPPGGIRSHLTPAQQRAAQSAIERCVSSFHLREVLTYQPTSHYWPLQWTETGIFVALGCALGAACVWWVGRRLPKPGDAVDATSLREASASEGEHAGFDSRRPFRTIAARPAQLRCLATRACRIGHARSGGVAGRVP